MSYYKTNAVYHLLNMEESHPFVWVAGNAWILIYGDHQATPKVIALVCGQSWIIQKEITQTVKTLASQAGLPLLFIQFDDTATSIHRVKLRKPGQQACELTLDQLKNEFQTLGLPVKKGRCGKSVNSATSSAYHNWQRSCLGAIKVTDIDLIRLNPHGVPIEAIELKRSFYALQDWQPYPDDYVNFDLLLAVCHRAGMQVTIAYNIRRTQPVFQDDASWLRLFSYQCPCRPVNLGILRYGDFLTGDYLVSVPSG